MTGLDSKIERLKAALNCLSVVKFIAAIKMATKANAEKYAMRNLISPRENFVKSTFPMNESKAGKHIYVDQYIDGVQKMSGSSENIIKLGLEESEMVQIPRVNVDKEKTNPPLRSLMNVEVTSAIIDTDTRIAPAISRKISFRIELNSKSVCSPRKISPSMPALPEGLTVLINIWFPDFSLGSGII